jgi:tRNA(adenine34) deaminase
MNTQNSKIDLFFMEIAFKQAQKAFANDEVPIGALVVDGKGNILGKGYNQVEKKKQQAAHAEIIAISRANKKKNDWRLDDCTLYVTLEPCIMCMGLIRLSRISCVVYAADSKLFGYQLDNKGQYSLYKKDIEIKKGILAEASAEILKKFFKQKRMLRG